MGKEIQIDIEKDADSEYQNSERDIFEIIRQNPGLHFRGIVSKSGKQIGVVSYHLHHLKEKNLISFLKDHNSKLYFDLGCLNEINSFQGIIFNLRKDIPRIILLSLTKFSLFTRLNIRYFSAFLQITEQAMYYHIKKMTKYNVIKTRRKGREVFLICLISSELIDRIGIRLFSTQWEIEITSLKKRMNSFFAQYE